MGLRGTAGTSHLDGGHAVIDTAECTAEVPSAEGLLPDREPPVHQEAKQLQTARAPVILQKAQQKYERLERPVEVFLQVGREVGRSPIIVQFILEKSNIPNV